MTSADLTADQWLLLCEQIAPVRDYQCRLHDRLVGRGFDGNDPLYREAAKAKNAVADLFWWRRNWPSRRRRGVDSGEAELKRLPDPD